MLVVESVVPGGPADGALEPGDVLVRLQGAVMTRFLPMDALLDGAVGARVAVEVERGGVPLSLDLEVRAAGRHLRPASSVFRACGCCWAARWGHRMAVKGAPLVFDPRCLRKAVRRWVLRAADCLTWWCRVLQSLRIRLHVLQHDEGVSDA